MPVLSSLNFLYISTSILKLRTPNAGWNVIYSGRGDTTNHAKQQYSLRLRKFVHNNLPWAEFNLWDRKPVCCQLSHPCLSYVLLKFEYWSSHGGLEVEQWSDSRTLSISVDQILLNEPSHNGWMCLLNNTTWFTDTTKSLLFEYFLLLYDHDYHPM